jgi:hypothetical protein
METDKQLLMRARESWATLEPFRRKRRLCKRYAYGNAGTRDNCNPNNLIRQLVKSVVGRYRYLVQGETLQLNPDALLERDARGLEEFLISGSVFQRISDGTVSNVSVNRILFERFSESDGADMQFIGMLHDMSRAELLRAFSQGDVSRGVALLQSYRSAGEVPSLPCGEEVVTFDSPDVVDACRVIELWHRVSTPILRCHDAEKGEYGEVEYSATAYDSLVALNEQRQRHKQQPIAILLDSRECWEEVWLTPRGEVLRRCRHEHTIPPFALKLYPLIDGEVHSLVEDVLGQQQLVNRMVALLDDILSHSAKGVLLFPADQLPEGVTWRDMRRIWSDPGGIVPYKRTSRNVSPQQINSSGWSSGAADMLKLQLQLFDEVAGVSASVRGNTSAAAGAEALRRETENCTIGMLDILAAYAAFTHKRDLTFNLNRSYESNATDGYSAGSDHLHG